MRKLGWITIAFVLISSGCVTRGVPTRQSELDALREVVRSGPTPAQQIGPSAKPNPPILDYYLHASGRVRCSGLIRKKQTAFLHAWATHPGPGGERVDIPVIDLKFDYQTGLFAGARINGKDRSTEEFSIHETITGVGDICSCVFAVSDATLLNTTRLVVKETICPE